MRTCSVENCSNKIRNKGLCNRHYLQMYKHGRIIDNDIKTCSVENCNNKHCAKGYCQKHYLQIREYGHILERTIFDKNEIIEYEDYAEIVLYKQNKEVARALIDLEYVDSIKQYKWCLTNNGYVYNDKVGRLHRFLMNPPDDLVVDHINRNPLDNRRCNLRICTSQQNSINKSKQSNNKSGVTGVFWHKKSNKWRACITLNNETIHLGLFDTIEEAAEARKQAEIEYFGEYAPNTED